MLQRYIVIVETGTLTISLPFSGVSGDIYEFCDVKRVELRCKNNYTLPVGIYCCDIIFQLSLSIIIHDIPVRDTCGGLC